MAAASTEKTERRKEGLTQTVYTVTPETVVWEAAELMRVRGVGDVIVVEDLKPVGILTDRDIVMRVTAAGLDPADVPVRNIMSSPLITVSRETEVSEGIALMARHGIRRLPIVDKDGRLASILTLDDILLLQLDDAQDVRDIIQRQLRDGEAREGIDATTRIGPIKGAPAGPRRSRSVASIARAAVVPPAAVEVWPGLRERVWQPGYVHFHRHRRWRLRLWLILALVALITALLILPYPLVHKTEKELTVDEIEAMKRASRQQEIPDLRELRKELRRQQPPELKQNSAAKGPEPVR
jgi:CBS domain-containing protein